MKKYHLLTKPLGSLFLAASLMLAGQSASWAQQRSAAQQLAVQQAEAQQSTTQLPSIVNSKPAAAKQASQAPLRPPKPVPTTRGPFETYVHTVTGASVGIFGQSLFIDVPSTFAPVESAPVNPDYVIGAGDELQIRGWGMVDIDINTIVDRSGAVNIPKVGSVKVAGVKYSDLQGHLTKAVAKFFNNFELTVSVSQVRAVQVYVVGHAVRPGTYTLSAMSTLLNALFTSGGPDAAGSMRNIQVKRGKEVVTSFDLYDMLINGDKSKDVTLRDGDVIYIPEAGPLVALTGNVKQAAIFELKGSTSLADVMRWAGGVDSSAENKRIVVEKSVDNSYKLIAELSGNSESIRARLGDVRVSPTDILRVFAPGAVPVQIQLQHEYVTVAGEMKQSGVFEIKKGETLRDLIARLGGPTDNGYIFATRMVRDSVRRSQQEKLDLAADRFEHDFETKASERLAQATDKDNIAAINADLERQRRAAQKLREVKAEGRIVLELEGSTAQVKDLPDLPLQDGDSIFVPRRPGTVEVIGAVYQQNSTLYRPRRTVSDYLSLAGGPTDGADKSEMYLIRADGTAKSDKNAGWFSGLGGATVNPGDTIVVPEKINRTSWVQSFKDWTTILYQFGLGAAGLKVLQN